MSEQNMKNKMIELAALHIDTSGRWMNVEGIERLIKCVTNECLTVITEQANIERYNNSPENEYRLNILAEDIREHMKTFK